MKNPSLCTKEELIEQSSQVQQPAVIVARVIILAVFANPQPTNMFDA
jgi:hypothetical protein